MADLDLDSKSDLITSLSKIGGAMKLSKRLPRRTAGNARNPRHPPRDRGILRSDRGQQGLMQQQRSIFTFKKKSKRIPAG